LKGKEAGLIPNLPPCWNSSLDYLVGIREMQVFDKSLLRRVEELANLPEQDRQGILFALDGLLRDAKARMAYQ
jgi:hypothetical protein